MNTKQKIEVMQAYLDGEIIEVAVKTVAAGPRWFTFDHRRDPVWDWKGADYRIAKTNTKPSINWDHVSPEFNYLASNMNQSVILYSCTPKLSENCWYNGGRTRDASIFASLTPGDCDWKDSLVSRFNKEE